MHSGNKVILFYKESHISSALLILEHISLKVSSYHGLDTVLSYIVFGVVFTKSADNHLRIVISKDSLRSA